MRRSRFSLALLVSGRCNLNCSYCYQDARVCGAEMAWPVARAALDHLFSSGADQHHLELTGGEPLLDPGFVRRCIHYARSGSVADRDVKIVLATNGILLTPPLLDYFEEMDVALRISLDGVAEAHELRAAGTFSRLDGLLDELATTRAEYLRRSVEVGLTLVAGAVPHLAASVRYVAAKGVPTIRMSPTVTPDGNWTVEHSAELARQTEGIVDFSIAHWRQTGHVPVDFLRREPARPEGPPDGFVCGGPSGNGLCVDPDGHAWACPMLAPSLHRLPPMALGPASALDLGEARDTALPRRLARLPARGRRQPIFTDKTGRYSSYARCRECDVEGECFICPAAICHGPDSGDPKRVPDALCAFNRATLHAREQFRKRTVGDTEAPSKGELAAALKRLTEALVRAESSPRSKVPRGRRGEPASPECFQP